MQHESPQNPAFRASYAEMKTQPDRFNWTYTYRQDSNVLATYGRLYERSKLPEMFRPFAHILKGGAHLSTRRKDEDGMVVWVVSRCKSISRRELIVAELQKYIRVDEYGSCGGTACVLSRTDSSAASRCHPNIDNNSSGSGYKFYLSFENAVCVDYVTEKFFNVLDTDMIPIVYGGANYKASFPPYSYIDVQDFPNVRALAEYLVGLLADPEEYGKYFQWRANYYLVSSAWLPGYCEICQKLLQRQAKKEEGEGLRTGGGSYYRNIYNWWIHGIDDGEVETGNYMKGRKRMCLDEDSVHQFVMRFTGN
jgi:alpha-1,3-fucosyltransferase